MGTVSKGRNGYFDFLRGIAICMVVAIHTVPSLSFEGSTTTIIQIVIRQTLNIAVPLFLAISGFFLAKKPIVSNEKISFWKSQIPKVYLPCIIWSLPLFVLSIISNKLTSFPIDILNLFFCGFSIYYFVALIIQYYILLPFLKFKIRTLCWSALLSAISIMIVSYFIGFMSVSLPLVVYAGPFPLWIVFFVLGGVLSCNMRDYKIWIPIVIMLVALVFQYFEGLLITRLQYGTGLGIKLSSFIFSAALIVVLFSKKVENLYDSNLKVSKILEYIGGISFGIYLIHCYCIIIVNKLVPFHTWVTDWAITLAMTCAIIVLARRISPTFAKKYLGFR